MADDYFLVNFIVAGTQKGGTTALWRYLRGSPDINLPINKEAHFFDQELFFGNDSPPRYDLYELSYDRTIESELVGDITPSYMFSPFAAQRIHSYNPQTRLIFLLRDPVERSYSHYWMNVRSGLEDLPFKEALAAESVRLTRAQGNYTYRSAYWLHSYKARGCYASQIARFLRYFPMEQLLCLRTDELRLNPITVLNRIRNFLGLSACNKVPTPAIINAGRYPELDRSIARSIRQNLHEETVKLVRLLNWDMSEWLSYE